MLREECLMVTQLSENTLQDEYDSQKASYRDLKRQGGTHPTLIFRDWPESALRVLQRRYELKAKRSSKKVPGSSAGLAQIGAPRTEVNNLTEELEKAAKQIQNALIWDVPQDLSKFQKMYREQKDFSKELHWQHDKFSATIEEVTKKLISLEKKNKAASNSGIQEKYEDLERTHERLKTVVFIICWRVDTPGADVLHNPQSHPNFPAAPRRWTMVISRRCQEKDRPYRCLSAQRPISRTKSAAWTHRPFVEILITSPGVASAFVFSSRIRLLK
ncbi:hypothetical protein DFH07DRAFT_784067 [Mycena maculata]|uniref:Uncharacterized protein n=1 Tax=Mycena maculata TaxID=230809 RepID=A0AAD7HIZ3_9AGAR|nr:hypothetical protein DFH07DRAFT_784067 [Mycena maculata]